MALHTGSSASASAFVLLCSALWLIGLQPNRRRSLTCPSDRNCKQNCKKIQHKYDIYCSLSSDAVFTWQPS
jgi:hypothetical protein